MSGAIEIGNGVLTARIASLGAELFSLTDAAGRQYMKHADPASWTGHAPLLFPIVGELKDGTYRLGDESRSLPRHGFARRRQFACLTHGREMARFRLDDDEETRAAYPFAFALEMAFELRDATLSIIATVGNCGERPMPFSFGFHPGFAWPLPGGGDKLAHEIVFERDEPQDIARLDGEGLLASAEATFVAGKILALRPGLFERDAMIWNRLESRALSYRGPGGTRLDIAFPACPMLALWQKPGADFLCIEPWAGIADPADFDGDFFDKPGVMTLAPGGERSLRMDVTVVPA